MSSEVLVTTYALEAPTQVLALLVSTINVSAERVKHAFLSTQTESLTFGGGSTHADLSTSTVEFQSPSDPYGVAYIGNVVHNTVGSGGINHRPSRIGLVVSAVGDDRLDPSLV